MPRGEEWLTRWKENESCWKKFSSVRSAIRFEVFCKQRKKSSCFVVLYAFASSLQLAFLLVACGVELGFEVQSLRAFLNETQPKGLPDLFTTHFSNPSRATM